MNLRHLLPFPMIELHERVGFRSYPGIHEVVSGKRACGPKLAIRIEAATGGALRRWMLRPDLWEPPEGAMEELAAATPTPPPDGRRRGTRKPAPTATGRRRGRPRKQPETPT